MEGGGGGGGEGRGGGGRGGGGGGGGVGKANAVRRAYKGLKKMGLQNKKVNHP